MTERSSDGPQANAPAPPPKATADNPPSPDPEWHVWIWRWCTASFLNHFLTNLPLPLALVLVLAMLTTSIGKNQGMDKQIWHDDPIKQFFVGASLTGVCAQILFVGYLLWLRDQRERRRRSKFPVISFGRYAW